MQLFWRNSEIAGHAEWRDRIARKDDQPGGSAPTLAAAWSGPLELLNALDRQPALTGLRIESLHVEAQTAFDKHPGGARNHDLLIVGTAAGGRVLVSVEAKAGETLGPTVAQYRRAAEKREAGGKPTKAPARLDALLRRFISHHDPQSERVEELRYQLLTAVAGTLAAANGSVNHAVLMLHEFLTDDRISQTERDLYRFVTTVFDFEPPGLQALPWCVELPALEPMAGEAMPTLYLAHAVTDLRPSSLRLASRS